jgi:hypothetical protein
LILHFAMHDLVRAHPEPPLNVRVRAVDEPPSPKRAFVKQNSFDLLKHLDFNALIDKVF